MLILIYLCFFLVELAMEARKFSIIQSEYLKECIKRSRYPGIDSAIGPPETANTAGYQLKNNLSFLVRLLFEILEGTYQTQS